MQKRILKFDSNYKKVLLLISIIFMIPSISIAGKDNTMMVNNIQEINSITPLWNNISRLTPILAKSNGQLECKVSVVGYSNVTSISATLRLEEYTTSGWKYLNSWSKAGLGSNLSSSYLYPAQKGKTYRLIVTVRATAGGQTETASGSTTIYYN